MKKASSIILTSLYLSGCSAAWVAPEPSTNISLEQAMESVAQGMANMDKVNGPKSNGLYPESVEIVFNVSASGTDSNKLTLADPSNLSSTLNLGSDTIGKRSNVITIKFASLIAKNGTIADMPLDEAAEVIRKARITRK